MRTPLAEASSAGDGLGARVELEIHVHVRPEERVSAVTNAFGHGVSFERDEAGNLVSVTDANGNVTQFQCTTMNRLSKILTNGRCSSWLF